ncbi:MAG: hypothetical protein WA751_10630 [Candidatus Dormiibacterota bacterium]
MRQWRAVSAWVALIALAIGAIALGLTIQGNPNPNVVLVAVSAIAACGIVLFVGDRQLLRRSELQAAGEVDSPPAVSGGMPQLSEFQRATVEFAAAQARISMALTGAASVLASNIHLRDRTLGAGVAHASDEVSRAMQTDLPILVTDAVAIRRYVLELFRSPISDPSEVRVLVRTRSSLIAARKSAARLRGGLRGLQQGLRTLRRNGRPLAVYAPTDELTVNLRDYRRTVGGVEKDFRAAERAATVRLIWVALCHLPASFHAGDAHKPSGRTT